MNSAIESTAFDRAVTPVLVQVLPNLVKKEIRFDSDPALATRIEELAAKANEGELTEEERREYQGYLRANKFIAMLRRQLIRLSDSHPNQP
jgi:hypothetical protein